MTWQIYKFEKLRSGLRTERNKDRQNRKIKAKKMEKEKGFIENTLFWQTEKEGKHIKMGKLTRKEELKYCFARDREKQVRLRTVSRIVLIK